MTIRFFALLFAVDLLFVVLHLLFGAQFDLFNLDRERTPAALFSALQFVGSGYAALIVALFSNDRRTRILFSIASPVLVLMGFDEIAELHENVTYYLAHYLPSFSFLKSATPMWVIFLSPLVGGIFFLFSLVIRRLIRRNFRSGVLMITGCVVFAAALLAEFIGNLQIFRSLSVVFIPLEEGLELLGGSLFLFALCSFAKTFIPQKNSL